MPNDEEVVIAAPAEGTTATESATAETEESQAAAAEATRSGGVQKRIDELTRKAKEAERTAEIWRAEALKAKPAVVEPVKPVVEEPKAKPTADQFETQEAFVEALTDWKLGERDKATEKKGKEDALRNEQTTAVQQFVAKTEAYKAEVTDFDDVMAAAGDIQISPALTHEVLTHENGPALQYYLAKNPAEADRLNQLSPLALAREIGRIESRFVSAPASKEPTQEKVTKAPAPIIPVSRTAAASTKDPGDMSPTEYRAWRAKNPSA